MAGKAVVGGTHRFDGEAIDRLRPDPVIGAKEENERAAILQLAGEIEAAFSSLRPLSPVRRTVYVIWPRSLMVAGRGTLIDDPLGRCGLVSAATSSEDARYPETTLDDLRSAGLEVLLLASEPHPFGEPDREAWEERLPGTWVHLVDGEMFSWYGSRLLKAVGYCRDLMVRLAPGGC